MWDTWFGFIADLRICPRITYELKSVSHHLITKRQSPECQTLQTDERILKWRETHYTLLDELNMECSRGTDLVENVI